MKYLHPGFPEDRFLAIKYLLMEGGKMSSATQIFGSFCTGCVAAAAAVIAVATLVTITWVLFL